MRYKVAIVDDDNRSAELIKNYLTKYSEKHSVIFDPFEFLDGDELINDYIANLDIIFLDIEMKRMDGMETAERIRKIDSDVIIIFITNMAQYAIKGYSVDAMSFLLKPLPYFAFSQELTKSLNLVEAKRHSYIVVNTDTGIRKVNTNEIFFIEVMKHTLIIHTVGGDFSLRGTIKEMESKLNEFYFQRCNNCYLVNLRMVNAIENDFVIVGKYKLKSSRPRKKMFMEALTSYVGRAI